MKAIFLIIAVITACFGCNSKNDSPAVKKESSAGKNGLASPDIQIKTALLAAPAEKRDSCTVLGYSSDKQLIVLRQGTNEMICLADNPDEPGFSVALYVYSADEKDFEPATGEVKNGYLRYVIYIPYATAASTGLPEKPSAPGMPWIMDAGKSRAHIMINPEKTAK